ncbi:MAG: threonine--tRNA ligase [Spirochaetales bacterium]|nr:threonine--tRNA ligase [Spirochaetales bacterium]
MSTRASLDPKAQEKADRLYKIRHTTAHVMAEAVLRMFPEAKIAIGPPIDNGFYYDFDLPRKLTEEDFETIEEHMRAIIQGKHPMTKEVITRNQAKARFNDQPYKLELVDAIPEHEEVSLFTVDTFTDLCRGPHVENTKDLNWKAFKLLRIAGAYWRGNSDNPMLTRIYGTAWEDPKEMREYLDHLKELEKRDHRRLGRELDLFHFEDDNPGQIFWHHNGWTIYRLLMEFVRESIGRQGYQEVHTPSVMPKSLWDRSGHWEKYQEHMFVTESEKRLFALKPMNCPGHIEIFRQGLKSYRDLPLRMAEFGSCVRNESSGALHGIMRVRGFVQDDAHIFCTEEQISSEVALFVELLKGMYKDLGFDEASIIVKFSTRPEKRVGDDATWDRAEGALAEACKQAGLEYEIAPGEGAFYGPKLEFTLVDALGREWQCGTIQVDYQLPSKERLDAGYIGEDGNRHTPVMLHRAVLGSLERFIGILLEHYGGAMPVWLAPIQAVVIPVAPAFYEGAQALAKELENEGWRVLADLGDERMNNKIRIHQAQKVPYMLVVGEQELASRTVAVRTRKNDRIDGLSVDEFKAMIDEKIQKKDVL